MKTARKIIVFLHFFIGAGACAGGLAGVLNPLSPMGTSVEVLKNGPFTDFFIPSLFLLVVLGLGNLGAALAALKKVSVYGYIAGAFGAVLCAWIVIQCLILQAVVFLHVLFFVIGAVQGLCALYVLWKNAEFPFNLMCPGRR